MRGERLGRAGLGWLAALVVVGAALATGVACTPDLCTRHSECPVGYTCSATAQCEIGPDAAIGAGGGDGGTTVPGNVDGGPIADLPDAAVLLDAALPGGDLDASAVIDAAPLDAGPEVDAAFLSLIDNY